MPYDNQGNWVEPFAPARRCPCAGCVQWTRDHGRTPEEEYLATLTEPEFNSEGFDQYGFDRNGYDQDGFDREGFDLEGFNHDGFNRAGRNREGFDRAGYDSFGFDRHGRDRDGFDREGRDTEGFDRYGFNLDGFNREGFNAEGWNREGFNPAGFNREGFDRDGFDRKGFNRDGLDRNGNPRPCMCHQCRVERGERRPLNTVTVQDVRDFDPEDYWDNGGSGWLNSYSYTPSPLNFYRNHGEKRDSAVFFGMEIEMTSDLSLCEKILGNRLGMDNELIYFKSDSSVEGFEAVTHPMTRAWAADNFPWHFVEVMKAAGASVESECNGLHIHVSRSGFKDEAHLYRWLRFWYRNQEDIIAMAGRNGGTWGSFGDDREDMPRGPSRHFRHAKGKAVRRHNPDRCAEDWAGERYRAINLQNEKTVEVRLFSATTSAHVLRSRFELVAASVEYTRNLTVKQVREGGWTWDSFVLWLEDNKSAYPALALRQLDNIGRAMARNNEPVLALA